MRIGSAKRGKWHAISWGRTDAKIIDNEEVCFCMKRGVGNRKRHAARMCRIASGALCPYNEINLAVQYLQ